MLPGEIFDDLRSQIEKVCKEKKAKKNWEWSVCGTPIQPGQPLLIGINWGGGGSSDKHKYTIQETMPSFSEFKTLYEKGEYSFLNRISEFAKDYCQIEISKGEFNYSNLCFFRTPNIKDLPPEDIKLSIPIFKSMLESIKPRQIISLGTGNIKYLKSNFQIPDEFEIGKPISVEGSSHKIFFGSLLGYKFYNLPHPNARKLSNEVYKKLWETLFSVNKQNNQVL